MLFVYTYYNGLQEILQEYRFLPREDIANLLRTIFWIIVIDYNWSIRFFRIIKPFEFYNYSSWKHYVYA